VPTPSATTSVRAELGAKQPRHRRTYLIIAAAIGAVALASVLVASQSSPSSISGPVDTSHLPDKGPVPALVAKGWINSPPLTPAGLTGTEQEAGGLRVSGTAPLVLGAGDASHLLLAAATGRGAQLEGINAVLLLTTEDDFNALASTMLAGSVEGAVYRLGPQLPSHGVVAPYTGGQILFGTGLTRYDVGRRYVAGARITSRPANGEFPAGTDLLFLVRADGKLMPVTTASTPGLQSGDTMIVLESAVTGS